MDKELLNKFINGQCSEEEVNQILTWYYSSEADRFYTHQIDHLIEKYTRDNIPNSDKEKIFDSILNKINTQKSDASIVPVRSYLSKSRPRPLSKIAAAVIALFIFSFIIYKLQIIKPTETAVNESEWIEKITTAGQKSTIFLNDGSKVTLNSNSKIRYIKPFSDTARVIWLEGEAFFDIKFDQERPFVVHAGDIKTTALGTSFNISHYPNKFTIKISLASGKIKINNENDKISRFEYLLNPGQGIIFDREKKSVEEVIFDPLEDLAWKDGILYFKDANFFEMIEKFEDWYGVTIQVENTAKIDKEQLFTGEFDNESLHNVLEGLSFSKNFTFLIENNNVKVKFK